MSSCSSCLLWTKVRGKKEKTSGKLSAWQSNKNCTEKRTKQIDCLAYSLQMTKQTADQLAIVATMNNFPACKMLIASLNGFLYAINLKTKLTLKCTVCRNFWMYGIWLSNNYIILWKQNLSDLLFTSLNKIKCIQNKSRSFTLTFDNHFNSSSLL